MDSHKPADFDDEFDEELDTDFDILEWPDKQLSSVGFVSWLCKGLPGPPIQEIEKMLWKLNYPETENNLSIANDLVVTLKEMTELLDGVDEIKSESSSIRIGDDTVAAVLFSGMNVPKIIHGSGGSGKVISLLNKHKDVAFKVMKRCPKRPYYPGHHHLIVKQLCLYEQGDTKIIAMEKCDEDAHKSKRFLTGVEYLTFLLLLWTNKISHGDIKPGNLMTKDGFLKIADFDGGHPMLDNFSSFRWVSGLYQPRDKDDCGSFSYDLFSLSKVLAQSILGNYDEHDIAKLRMAIPDRRLLSDNSEIRMKAFEDIESFLKLVSSDLVNRLKIKK